MSDRILLVDDEDDIRRVLGVMLADLGCTVHAAKNAEEGLRLFPEVRPEIVFTDIKMPGMDGIEFLQRIKSAYPDTEVVMMTGYEDWDLAVRSLKEGATDFISKPVKPDILEVALKRSRSKISMRRQLQEYTDGLQRMVEEKTLSLYLSQQRYQQLFDEAPCYISVQDRDLRITAANRLFKEDFGDVVGGYCYEVYKHRSEPCSECIILKTFEDGKSHQTETVVASKSGEKYNVLIWSAPLVDAAGKVTHVIEMSTNITQIRELQDHLSSLGLLIASTSHGIKGLLTALDSGIYKVNLGFSRENWPQIRAGWDVVVNMVGRVKNMVLDMLYYAKERELEWEEVDALSLLHDVVSALEPKTQTCGIEFTRNFSPGLTKFEADASAISSALVNILENAVDACLEDRAKKTHRIVFEAREDGENVIFDICDTGIGMDRETREKMFTLFFSSKGSRGTGLGLFVSHHIVQQHGGSIDVESTPGQGSRFRITLPKLLPREARSV